MCNDPSALERLGPSPGIFTVRPAVCSPGSEETVLPEVLYAEAGQLISPPLNVSIHAPANLQECQAVCAAALSWEEFGESNYYTGFIGYIRRIMDDQQASTEAQRGVIGRLRADESLRRTFLRPTVIVPDPVDPTPPPGPEAGTASDTNAAEAASAAAEAMLVQALASNNFGYLRPLFRLGTVAQSRVRTEVPEIMNNLGLFFANSAEENLIFKSEVDEQFIRTHVSNQAQQNILIGLLQEVTIDLNETVITALVAARGVSNWPSMRRDYWIPQLAMIFASQLDDPVARRNLERLYPELADTSNAATAFWRNITDWQNRDQERNTEIALLAFIEQQISPANQTRFAYMMSQNYFSRAMLYKSLGDNAQFRTFLRRSREAIYGRLVPTMNDNGCLAGPLDRAAVRPYLPGLTAQGTGVTGAREVARSEAMAHLMMAELLTIEVTGFNKAIALLQRIRTENFTPETRARKLAKIREQLQAIVLTPAEQQALAALLSPNPSLNNDEISPLEQALTNMQTARLNQARQYISCARAVRVEPINIRHGRITISAASFRKLGERATSTQEQQAIVAYLRRERIINTRGETDDDWNGIITSDNLPGFTEEDLRHIIRLTQQAQREPALRGIDGVKARLMEGEIELSLAYQAVNNHEPSANYLPLFASAAENFDGIIELGEQYQRHLDQLHTTEPNAQVGMPRYLTQLITQAKVSRARLNLAVVGELTLEPEALVVSILGLSQESTRTRTSVLQSQRTIISDAVATLELAQGQEFYYVPPPGENWDQVPVQTFRDQQAQDLRLSLSEARARLAFIQRDLANIRAYASGLARVERDLTALLSESQLTPMTRALANFWMAKSLVIRASNARSIQGTEVLVEQARPYLAAARKANILHGSLISSVHQAIGETYLFHGQLNEAETELNHALELDRQNYEARISLTDLHNQQGKFSQALTEYNELRADVNRTHNGHLLLARIDLGISEAQMRLDANYSQNNLENIERQAFALISTEPRGSYLITRAIDALLEAYGTNANYHDRIILLLNTVLRQSNDPEDTARRTNYPELNQALNRFGDRRTFAYLPPRFRARLWLRLIETTSWLRQPNYHFDEARTRLNELNQNTRMLNLINRDRELQAQLLLVEATIEMRDQRDVDELPTTLQAEVMASLDPNLVSTYFLTRLEGLAYEKEFDDMIRLINDLLANTTGLGQEVRRLFENRGQQLAYEKFILELHLQRADARIWQIGFSANRTDWTPDYQPALADLDAAWQQTETIGVNHPLAYFARLAQAQILIRRGDINSYHWIRRNYTQARTNYNDAVTLLEDTNSESLPQRGLVLLTQAHAGRGSILSDQEGQRELRLERGPALDQAREEFEQAVRSAESLPAASEERDRLLFGIYRARAQFAEADGNRADVNLYLQAMYRVAARLRRSSLEALELLSTREVEQRYTDHSGLEADVRVASHNGYGAEGIASEIRETTRVQLPFSLLRHVWPGAAHVTGGLYFENLVDLAQNDTTLELDTTITSQRLGLYYISPPVRQLSNAAFSLRTSLNLAAQTTGGNSFPNFTRRPFWDFALSVYQRDLIGAMAFGINSDSRYNTYYGSLGWNFAGTVARHPNLPFNLRHFRLRTEYNAYTFFQNTSHFVHSITPLAIDFAWDIPFQGEYDPLVGTQVRLSLSPVIVQIDQELWRQHYEENIEVDPISLAFRFKLEILFNFSRYVTGFINGSVQSSFTRNLGNNSIDHTYTTFDFLAGLIFYFSGNRNISREESWNDLMAPTLEPQN